MRMGKRKSTMPKEKSAYKEEEDPVESDDEFLSTSEKNKKQGKTPQNASDNEERAEDEEEEPLSKPKRNKRKKASKAESVSDGVTDGEIEYEVKTVLDVRGEGKDREFLVRWKGFGANDDTWEPEDNLNCKDLIEAFLIKQEKPKEKATKKGRPAKQGRKAASKNGKNNSEEEETTAEYEVKKILEVHLKKDGKREYLVRWKGFSAKDDTWEPEENLSCSQLIQEFEEKLAKVKNSTQRETRVQRKPANRMVYDTSSRRGKNSRTRGLRVTYYDED